MSNDEVERLGTPDVQFAGLRIWVHGRAFPDAMDYWDGNWLTVTALCSEAGASVWVHGPALDVISFHDWAKELEQLYEQLQGEAVLSSHEPSLEARASITDSSGHVLLHLRITPDHMTQQHAFDFDLDQSYLPGVAQQCRSIVARFPIRDAARRGV